MYDDAGRSIRGGLLLFSVHKVYCCLCAVLNM